MRVMMRKLQRTQPLSIVAFLVVGVAVGFGLQLVRSARGIPPFVPPISLAVTLIVFAAVLTVLGVLLHRAVRRDGGRPVNPFHAVRLLAGAKASQFAGGLFAGFGAGLAGQLLLRSVPAPPATWVPMVLVLVAGVILLVCGVIVEVLCRVPPADGDDERAEGELPAARDESAGREGVGGVAGPVTPSATRNTHRGARQ